MNPQQFLRRVWRSQPKRGHAFLAYFDSAHVFHDEALEPLELNRLTALELPNEGKDVYFAPCLFSQPKRRKDEALPGRWLYADLDESDPRELESFEPTIAWQTSPGRYQALWELKRTLAPRHLSALNQRVTYFTEADRGGWSLTKVLRLPGTVSLKRETRHRVQLLWDNGPSWDPREVVNLTRNTKLPTSATVNGKQLPLPRYSTRKRKTALNDFRGRLPTRARKLIRSKTAPVGTRSERIWELENILLEAGMTPEQTYLVVRTTVWNKHKGKDAQLWAEVLKAHAQLKAAGKLPSKTKKEPKKSRIARKPKAPSKRRQLPTRDSSDDPPDEPDEPETDPDAPVELPLISSEQAQTHPTEPPAWMVSGIWSQDAHGLLAGAPKAFKSTIALDLSISVASGTKFLDHFDVSERGPVLFFNEENNPEDVEYFHEQILRSRGLALGATQEHFSDGQTVEVNFGYTVPLFFLHHWGFDLRDKDHLKALDRAMHRYEPSLVVLDPFYRMAPGIDENSAKEVQSVLGPLLDLKQWHGCGILVIHHFKKQNTQFPTEGGERVSGSGVFRRWFESAVYAEPSRDDPATVILSTEQRRHGPGPHIHVTFDLGDNWSHYAPRVVVGRDEAAQTYDSLRELVRTYGKHGCPVSDAADRLGMTRNGVRKQAQRAGMHLVSVSGKRGGRPVTVIQLNENPN